MPGCHDVPKNAKCAYSRANMHPVGTRGKRSLAMKDLQLISDLQF